MHVGILLDVASKIHAGCEVAQQLNGSCIQLENSALLQCRKFDPKQCQWTKLCGARGEDNGAVPQLCKLLNMALDRYLVCGRGHSYHLAIN